MQYRFRPSEHPQKKDRPLRRQYRLRGADTLRSKHALPPDPIEWIPLFDEEQTKSALRKERRRARRQRRALRWQAARAALERSLQRVTRALRRLIGKLSALRRPKKVRAIRALPVFSGALCAALLVSALSAGGVLCGLFFRYGRSFDAVTVPDFVGKSPDDVILAEDSPIQRIIQYEYNPDVPEGLVISQSPRGGVVRRIYEKNGVCVLTLTVSRGDKKSELADLRGMTRRDASLMLKNQGLQIAIRTQYSTAVPKGAVIRTDPQQGTSLLSGETVTLLISLGKQTLRVSVPDLLGKTEQAASSLLSSAGLRCGSVSYESSSLPIGTVIAQSVTAGKSVDEGSTVAITVSAGDRYASHTVPNLYGMTEEQANAALRQHGLVIGSIYTTGSGAGNRTVIAQTPVAGTPITSSTVSVDLYLSS